MLRCPKCLLCDWGCVHRSPIEPAEDRFVCTACGHKFSRYDGLAAEDKANRTPDSGLDPAELEDQPEEVAKNKIKDSLEKSD